MQKTIKEILKEIDNMSSTQFSCADCGAEISATDSACPKCGSKNRMITASEGLIAYDFIAKLLERDKNIYDGDRKYYKVIHRKMDFDRDTQQPSLVYREYNRAPDIIGTDRSYIKRVLTLDGTLINGNGKQQCESLPNHQGRGSARWKRKKEKK